MSESKPKLIRNCRLSDSPHQKDYLVMPEGAIRLKGSGVEILSLCDGVRDLKSIISELQSRHAATDPTQIESEVVEFLNELRKKRVLDF